MVIIIIYGNYVIIMYYIIRGHKIGIHRYDDADILAGQGTIGIEVQEQMYAMGEPVDAIVVPVGGGGLIAGISIAMKHLSPDTEVIVSDLLCEMELYRKCFSLL